MEVQWQLPFIFRTNMIQLTLAAHPVTKSRTTVTVLILGHMLNSHHRKSWYKDFNWERKERQRAHVWEKQSCGGHILQRHIYYFTAALGKGAALGLCWTHSTNDNHWVNSMNTGEWASNVQGEAVFFLLVLISPTPPFEPYKTSLSNR